MKKKPLIVVGAGNPDNSDMQSLTVEGDILVAGSAILNYMGHVDALAVWFADAKVYDEAVEMRKKNGLNTDFACYSFIIDKDFEHFPLPCYSAGSGMYAVQVGIALGYEKIILVDMPLDGHCEAHRAGWKEAFPLLKDKVRSLSGYTKKLFGAPDDEWLKQ